VEICRPLELTDPSVVVGLLLALSPLAPDIAKLQLGGLLTFERRLEKTEQSQEALRGQVQAIALAQSQRQSMQVTFSQEGPIGQTPIHVSDVNFQTKKQEFLEASDSEGDQ
jgi:hypothetical protein